MNINEEILLRYIQQDISEEELKEVNTWLAESEENRRELFRLEAIWSKIRMKTYSQPAYMESERNKLKLRIEREKRTIRRSRLTKFARYAAIAVVVLLASAGVFSYLSAPSMQVITANNETVEQVLLSDGTKIWLNKGSQLTYSKSFNKKERTVYLKGEGYFEVAKDTSRPFVVHASDMDITVLGTIFNVQEVSDVSTVTLIEGEVRVRGNNDEGQITLSPGQKAELNKITSRMHVKELSNPSVDVVWHNGLIPFKQASVYEIGTALENLYGMKVHIAPDIFNTTYSGVLKTQDSINTVLTLLKNSIPIEYEIKGNEIFIRNKPED